MSNEARVRRRYWLILVPLVVLLRCWALDFGLPWKRYADEDKYVRVALGMFKEGDLNPHYFQNPPLWTYSLLPNIGGLYAALDAFGAVDSPAEFRELVHADPTPLYLASRLQAVLISLLTLLVVWNMARALGGEMVALFAVTSLGIGYLGVREAHLAVNDSALALATIGILALALRWLRRVSAARSALLGALVGVAVGIKYTAILIVPTFVLCVLIGSRGETLVERAKRLAVGLGAAAAVFTLCCPWFLLDSQAFFASYFEQVEMTRHPWSDQPPEPSWKSIATTFRTQLGAVGIAALVAGAVALLRAQPAGASVLLSYLAVYLFMALRSVLFGPRYLLPLMPICALFVGSGAVWAWRSITPRLAARPLGTALALLVATLVLFGEPMLSTLRGMLILSQEDTRVVALRWVEREVPSGARVLDIGAELPIANLMEQRSGDYAVSGRTIRCRSSLEVTSGAWKELEDDILAADYAVISDHVWARRGPDRALVPNATGALEFLAERGELVAEFSPYTSRGSLYPGGLCEPDIPFYELHVRWRLGNHLKIYRLAQGSGDAGGSSSAR